jgi:hypothetical protein
MDKQENVGTWPGDAERQQESGAAAPGHGGRMSRQRKTAAVPRREDLELVSRSLGVTAATLTAWRMSTLHPLRSFTGDLANGWSRPKSTDWGPIGRCLKRTVSTQ